MNLKNRQLSIMTILSALIFCSLIIAGTLSPFADIGRNANQFNSLNMWFSIIMMMALYMIPLFLYVNGKNWMIYVLAAVCSIGLVGHFSVLVSAGIFGYIKGMPKSMIGVIIISVIGVIIHIYWFKTAFRRGSIKKHKVINMEQEIKHQFWTVVMIQDGDEVLLLDRQHDDFKGFIPPGGKVDFPESFVDGAIREVKEETGLEVSDLVFKGISEIVNPKASVRYIMMNYWTKDFTGQLLENPPEGELHWVKINEVKKLPMQDDIKLRFDLFFETGTFEIQTVWNEGPEEVIIKKT